MCIYIYRERERERENRLGIFGDIPNCPVKTK
jgi:hypothetical protein